MAKLNSTAYALLGLLSRRPWTAYELAKHMQVSVLNAFNSRVASYLYAEAKRLHRQGLVAVNEEFQGRRKRQLYTITETGRAALAEWLQAGATAPFRDEWETMLRLLFQDQCDGTGVADTLARMEREIRDYARTAAEGIGAVLVEDRFQSQFLLNAKAIELVVSTLELRLAWVEEFRRLAAALPAVAGPDTVAEARASYLESHRRLITLLGRLGDRPAL